MIQVQAAAAGAMGVLGLAAGAIGFYGIAPAQMLTVTSVFSVFMVCSAAGEGRSFQCKQTELDIIMHSLSGRWSLQQDARGATPQFMRDHFATVELESELGSPSGPICTQHVAGRS